MHSNSGRRPARQRESAAGTGGRGILVSAATLLATARIALGADTALAADDPLEWRPPAARPAFRKRLSDDEYRRLSAPIAARLPRAIREAATRLPDHGLKLSGVFAPGALEAEGVTPNDVIAKVDGVELWGRHSRPDDDDPVRVQVYSAGQDRLREIKVATGLDHAFSIHRRPDLPYLRGKDRKAAWDADAIVGLVAASSAPDLAETAWQRALAAGFPRNRPCLASGALLALEQGRPETALDFWYEAEHNGGTEPLDPLLGYRVLIANFKLEPARDLARRHPKLFPDVAEGLESLAALHRAQTPGERSEPPPSAQARGRHRRDARGDLIGLSPLAEGSFLPRLTNRDVFRNAVPSDHYGLVALQAPQRLGDFELRLGMTLAPTDARRAGFVKLARLTLAGARIGGDPDRPEAGLIGHVELEVPSGYMLRHCEPGAEIAFPDPMVAADGKTRNAVRIVRVGGQVEIFLNERRVVYQPIPRDLKLQDIRFQIVGLSADVDEFALEELIPRL
jgi:hypothetical protein